VPFIGPFTGAEFLRNPFNRYVVNIRASYFQETEAWIEHLTNDLGVTRVAILYQDDAFGLSGLAGVKKAMERRNLSLVAEGTFKRNTTAIKSALLEIMKPAAGDRNRQPTSPSPHLKLARQLSRFDIRRHFQWTLRPRAGAKAAWSSQVVPFPAMSLPIVASYCPAHRRERNQTWICVARGPRPARGRSDPANSGRAYA
jgi:hypothetical protein